MAGSRGSAIGALARAVAQREISAVAVVEAALDRIRRLDPALNAVVASCPDSALEAAAALDRAISEGTAPGALAGVPVLVKDLEDVEGLPTTQGSLLVADPPAAPADDLVPARLRAAGAIVVGKTNLPEFAIEGFTDNLRFGATLNPWNTAWSPGGSSGGSAAAIAAGLVPVATATDGGGSIRIPAAFCGLVGLKPTRGVVGSWPPPDWLDLSTFGPFATTVADLRLLLDVERGPAHGDPVALPSSWAPAGGIGPTRLVAAHRTSDLGPLPAEVARLFDAAARELADVLRLDLTWMEPRDFFTGGDPDLDWFTLASAAHVASIGRDRVTAAMDVFHPATRAFLEAGLEVGIDEYLAVARRRFSYVRRIDGLLGDTGLLVTPTVARTGWAPGGGFAPGMDPQPLPPDAYSTAVQNMTGHPAITLPAGISGAGVPFGLQVTGPRHADGLLLDVAAAWEGAHPWPLVAPGYDPFELAAL